jgi:hypothetical protein
MMARGDRLRCSRNPGSNSDAGLIAPRKSDLYADDAAAVYSTVSSRCRSARPVGNSDETPPSADPCPTPALPAAADYDRRIPPHSHSVPRAVIGKQQETNRRTCIPELEGCMGVLDPVGAGGTRVAALLAPGESASKSLFERSDDYLAA